MIANVIVTCHSYIWTSNG